MGEEKKCPKPQAKSCFEQYQNSSGLEVSQALQYRIVEFYQIFFLKES
jgi:hypothetical protein